MLKTGYKKNLKEIVTTKFVVSDYFIKVLFFSVVDFDSLRVSLEQ
jgi:hypothetical protein